MSTFAQLKTRSKDLYEKLSNEIQNQDKRFEPDKRFWQPETDKVGNGYAVIRFLPAVQGEELPYIRIWDHGFQGPGGMWYIEKSLTTLGLPDPLAEYNSQLWKTEIKENQEVVRKQKRRLHYISNIYVVKDPAHPENEGQVFLFSYGKKIFDKLNLVMHPSFPDEKAINPFDLWEGANLKLKIRKVEGYRNYDLSEFDKPGGPLASDEEMEKIWGKCYPLQPFLDPSNFKSYDQLKTHLAKVLGWGNQDLKSPTTAETVRDLDQLPVGGGHEASPPLGNEADASDQSELEFLQRLADAE